MKHYTTEHWEEYVAGQLSSEERTKMELHMYTCDPCLELYTSAIEILEKNGIQAVHPGWNENWTDELMETIQHLDEEHKNRTPPVKKKIFFRPLFQYSVAAAITSVVMFISVFLQVNTSQPIMIDIEPKVTLTDQLMERTITLIDSIYPYER